jgi:hypothetical protein
MVKIDESHAAFLSEIKAKYCEAGEIPWDRIVYMALFEHSIYSGFLWEE